MKFCERCGIEIDGGDGENHCSKCASKIKQSKRSKARRREREDTLRDLGLTKVRGALGGTYWE